MVGRLALVCVAVAAMGCTESRDGECDVRVPLGDNAESALQTALIEQPSGRTVCLEEGTYRVRTELSVAKPGIRLRGAGREATVIDFAEQDLGANGLQITGDDVTIEALTVQDTPGDGIRATQVRNVAFLDVTVRWSTPASIENGAYGLYPVGCDGVRIERCLVSGSRDAGIYVGQSTRILVTDSEAFGNVAGIEIENSTDAEVAYNRAYDNTGGILVFNLPGLPVQDGKRAKIHHNEVLHNNLPSFAEGGTVVADVPAGTGVIILASDDNEVHDNVIEGNDSVGVIFIHYLAALFGPYEDPAFNPYPEGNYVHDNRMGQNGNAPAPLVLGAIPMVPVPDIVWDGCIDPSSMRGADGKNCVRNNGAATYFRADLCGDFDGMTSTDISEATCEHEVLPVQNP
ncbi:MAG TPA: parallel beta-helix domain-containing protein [Polyangiaceae bacterium]|jgi:parallel beta-helix repeat protein|nr:parallel beta-helix domain-containing protein [Polyangiaceae bacterium]